MCFDHDSEPPIEAGDREITTNDLTLTARDGNEFMAFEAYGAVKSQAAIVVLPDVRGLFQFYKDLASRFAQAGHDSIAIDYFGRTAGLGERTNDWDFRPHVNDTTFEGVRDDVTAAVSRVRAGNPDRPVFTVGFCFGGSYSWHQAANGLQLSGVVGFLWAPHPARRAKRRDRSGRRYDVPRVGVDGRRRSEHSAGRDRCVRGGTQRRRCDQRGHHLSGRPPLVLRPQVRRVRR